MVRAASFFIVSPIEDWRFGASPLVGPVAYGFGFRAGSSDGQQLNRLASAGRLL